MSITNPAKRVCASVVLLFVSAGLVLQARQQKPLALSPADGVPLTTYGATLLAVRFAPQAVDEEKLIRPIEQQIAAEQRLWQRFGRNLEARGTGRWYRKLFGQGEGVDKPELIYEWQAFANHNSALRDQLLSLFLDPNASVSGISDVFLFSREKIEDREPRFAAHELLPVYKQHLELAAAKTPATVWFSVPLPKYSYDFQKRAITFQPERSNPISEYLDESDGLDVLRPVSSEYYRLQGRGRDMVNYSTIDIGRGMQRFQQPSVRPDSPTNSWRGEIASGSNVPSPAILAADRRLRFTSLPLDIKLAEQLAKGEAYRTTSAGLTARVFMTVTGADVGSVRIDREYTQRFSVLFVQIRRVEVHGPDGEVLASIQGANLPAPSAAAPKGAARQ